MLPNEGWAAIQYVFGLRDLYAVIVTRDAIQLRRLDLKPDDPGHEIQNFREQIATRDLAYSAAARRLYDRLVKPLLADLGRKRNLVIVPDGALWHLPFAALLAPNGKHLLEEYALSISPSLATLREVRRRAGASPGVRKPSLLAVGRGPSAAGTSGPEKEAAAIGALWGTSAKLLVGDNAREDLVKREASGYSIVHLAAHGVFEDRNALYSHVSLAPSRNAGQPDEDGLLEAREFLQLDWPADLVVLSACETARGKSEYAEGMVGLTWAVTAAGARTTLASQWKVDADATTKLMLAFHRAWKTNISAPHPLARAQVFRSAATAVMASPYRKHPYYWAGFVLFGDGF